MEEKEPAAIVLDGTIRLEGDLIRPVLIDYDRAVDYEAFCVAQCEVGSGSFWHHVQIAFPLPSEPLGPIRAGIELTQGRPVGPGYIGYLHGVGVVTVWF